MMTAGSGANERRIENRDEPGNSHQTDRLHRFPNWVDARDLPLYTGKW